ncbi:MAG: VWA domain-containing protein [Planctomycetaceae bacterium]|nr:VWA domain-containing protein [Planctomycetaceae bacterium]
MLPPTEDSKAKTQESPHNPHRGGVIHSYQQYDPGQYPSPTQPAPDLVSPAFEHMLAYGSMREFSEEELANAIRLDPGQFAGLGPSLDALIAMLKERREKILATWETDSVQKKADKQFSRIAQNARPGSKLAKSYWQAVKDEQIYQLEAIWYRAERSDSKFASQVLSVMESLGEKYQIDYLASNWEFKGRKGLSIPEALEILDELKKIEELLKQLEDAKENAQLAVIDLEDLGEFADPEAIANISKYQEMIQQYLKEIMEGQGLSQQKGQIQLAPKAYKLFQGKLLDRIFSGLQASRTGRHQGPIEGDGAVELQRTRPYEFGDSVTSMDIPSTMINAMLRQGKERPLRLHSDDIEIHRTRNTPRCATMVLMDMSGSMRYDGQYVNVKRMALALNGLITSEYPGDFLRFVEVATFAKLVPQGELLSLMPKIPTITNPVVRLRADMSREEMSEIHIPPHFTNIQHALQMARQSLATQDTPNRQIVLITDGLPTAHFEGSQLYMLYPPDPQTEIATMREGQLCRKEGITINMFLLPSWSQSHEDVQFAHRLAESTGGRVFFTAGRDLDRYVVWDYVNQRREIIS